MAGTGLDHTAPQIQDQDTMGVSLLLLLTLLSVYMLAPTR